MRRRDERQRLEAIESGLQADDPAFYEAMRAWRPCPPREYRRARPRTLLLSSLVLLAVVAAVLAGTAFG